MRARRTFVIATTLATAATLIGVTQPAAQAGPEPAVLTCGADTGHGGRYGRDRTVTATDPDDTVVDLAITGVIPVPAAGTISPYGLHAPRPRPAAPRRADDHRGRVPSPPAPTR